MEEEIIITPTEVEVEAAPLLDDELASLLTRYLQREMHEGDYAYPVDEVTGETIIPSSDFLHKPFDDYSVTEGILLVSLIIVSFLLVISLFRGRR